MLARVQHEQKLLAIRGISNNNKVIRNMLKVEKNDQLVGEEDDESNDPFANYNSPPNNSPSRRRSMLVLRANDSSKFDVCERNLLGIGPTDQLLMKKAARYARYAQVIYSRLRLLVAEEFMLEETDNFVRELDTLFEKKFSLESIGCDHGLLCYANFMNGQLQTPYAVIIDEEMKTIVLTIRGTLSVDDMVVDFQYNPASLEKAGTVCGFDGVGHQCHNGFLTRAKWLYNDIKW